MGLFTVHNQGGSIFFQNTKVTCILLYNKKGGGGGSRNKTEEHNCEPLVKDFRIFIFFIKCIEEKLVIKNDINFNKKIQYLCFGYYG